MHFIWFQGCLVEVGKGKMEPSQVKELLEERNRRLAPATAPAHGLYLAKVEHTGLVL